MSLYPLGIREIQVRIFLAYRSTQLFLLIFKLFPSLGASSHSDCDQPVPLKEGNLKHSKLCLLKDLVIQYFQRPTEVIHGYYTMYNACS